ncbi:MAG: Cysteine synthase, CysO-dependent, partial [uncultured Blastococcus sp.]
GPLRLPRRLARRHSAGRAAVAVAVRRRPAVGQAGGPQPDRVDQGPRGDRHDRGGGEGRRAAARRDDPGADQRQHRHLPGDGGQAARLPAHLRHAGEHLDRAPPAAGDVRRADHLLPGRGRLEPGGRRRQGPGSGARGLGDALPVRQPGQRPGALRRHRSGDPGRPALPHALRRRTGHHRHAHGRLALPARAQARRPGDRRRAALRRAGLRPAQHRRGVHPRAVRPRAAGLPVLRRPGGRGAPHPAAGGARGHLRRHLHRRDPARGPRHRRQGGRRGPPGRHLLHRVRRRLEVPLDRCLRRHARGGQRRARGPALGV